MKSTLIESLDSVLINGVAFFGKHGRTMLITKVNEYRPRKNSRRGIRFELIMSHLTMRHNSTTTGRVISFQLDQIEVTELSRVKLVYRFLHVSNPARNTLTVFLASPDDLVLTF